MTLKRLIDIDELQGVQTDEFSLLILDEGVEQGSVTELDFTGSNLVVTASGDRATLVHSSGGGGGGGTADFLSVAKWGVHG